MLNFVSPGERSASAGHQDKLLNPRRILVNPGELVSLIKYVYRNVGREGGREGCQAGEGGRDGGREGGRGGRERDGGREGGRGGRERDGGREGGGRGSTVYKAQLYEGKGGGGGQGGMGGVGVWLGEGASTVYKA